MNLTYVIPYCLRLMLLTNSHQDKSRISKSGGMVSTNAGYILTQRKSVSEQGKDKCIYFVSAVMMQVDVCEVTYICWIKLSAKFIDGYFYFLVVPTFSIYIDTPVNI